MNQQQEQSEVEGHSQKGDGFRACQQLFLQDRVNEEEEEEGRGEVHNNINNSSKFNDSRSSSTSTEEQQRRLEKGREDGEQDDEDLQVFEFVELPYQLVQTQTLMAPTSISESTGKGRHFDFDQEMANATSRMVQQLNGQLMGQSTAAAAPGPAPPALVHDSVSQYNRDGSAQFQPGQEMINRQQQLQPLFNPSQMNQQLDLQQRSMTLPFHESMLIGGSNNTQAGLNNIDNPAPQVIRSGPSKASASPALDLNLWAPGGRNDRKFACTWDGCGKMFMRKTDVTRHFRIHLNDRPFKCGWPECGKSFMQRSAVKIHYRTHTGEKPNHCPFEGCNKSFNDTSSLARHRRTHKYDEPFPCSCRPCPEHFATRKQLQIHERDVHNIEEVKKQIAPRSHGLLDSADPNAAILASVVHNASRLHLPKTLPTPPVRTPSVNESSTMKNSYSFDPSVGFYANDINESAASSSSSSYQEQSAISMSMDQPSTIMSSASSSASTIFNNTSPEEYYVRIAAPRSASVYESSSLNSFSGSSSNMTNANAFPQPSASQGQRPQNRSMSFSHHPRQLDAVGGASNLMQLGPVHYHSVPTQQFQRQQMQQQQQVQIQVQQGVHQNGSVKLESPLSGGATSIPSPHLGLIGSGINNNQTQHSFAPTYHHHFVQQQPPTSSTNSTSNNNNNNNNNFQLSSPDDYRSIQQMQQTFSSTFDRPADGRPNNFRTSRPPRINTQIPQMSGSASQISPYSQFSAGGSQQIFQQSFPSAEVTALSPNFPQ